jgi:hypothetical protein
MPAGAPDGGGAARPGPSAATDAPTDLVLTAAGALLGWLVWASMSWSLVHDAPNLHYIAWLMGRGVVPYRDLVEMNWPGTLVIHFAVLQTVGAGDLAWRLVDLGWLALTGGVLFWYCRPLGGWRSGLAAALLFGLVHLGGGAWQAGQRDYLMCVLLLAGAAGVARAAEQGGAVRPLFLAGLALGAAASIKPHAALYGAACAAAALAARAGGPRRPLTTLGALVAGGAVVPAALAAWLGATGALGPFLDLFFGYVVPLYGPLARVPLATTMRWYPRLAELVALLGATAALGAVTAWRRGPRLRLGLLLAGIGYGAVHFVLQGKGWEYYLYPLACFLCAVAGLALAPPAAPRRLPALARPAVAVALVGLTLGVLALKGARSSHLRWVDEKLGRVAALSSDLARVAPPGARVQVMDVSAGGIHALLRRGLVLPSRFLNDFHFFHDLDHPRVQAMRGEFLTVIEGGVDALVVMRDGWPRRGYVRLQGFSPLVDVLARDYTLAVEGDGYRIYAPRARS